MSTRGIGLVAVAAAAALLGGCFLPVGTAAPQSAATVGTGRFGMSFHTEAPTLNLIADSSDNQSGAYSIAPAASMSFGVQYGLDRHLDLEVSAEAALYLFFLPIPTGATAGLRYQLIDGPGFDVALAGKLGWVSLSTSSSDSMGNTTEERASARYASLSGVIALHDGPLRPLLAVNLMPASVYTNVNGATSFTGLGSSITLGVTFVAGNMQITPFGALTYFASQSVEGSGYWSVGISFAARPDKAARPPTFAPVPMAPPPSYPPPPDSGSPRP
jgi:hypothetical protein